MILKVGDALKLFSRTDPDYFVHRDTGVKFPTGLYEKKLLYFTIVPR